jgi:glycosyltransferase involved in cell wall biosynthesis
MMERSGLERVEFSESMPYWCVMGYRPLVDTLIHRPEKAVVMKSEEGCFQIVHIITGLNIGGAETMLCKLLSEMDNKGFSQAVISLMEGGTLKEKIESYNIPVHSLGMKQGIPSLRSIWDLKKLICKLKPDLIQGWMYHGNLAASLARFLYGQDKVKLLWNVRASMSNFEKRLTYAVINLGARLSKYADRVIYNSFTSQREHRILNYDTNNSTVIPNGFETELFKPDSMARSYIRKELGLQDHTFLVGRIARYHPVKGHVTFLEAAAKLLKKKPDIFFLLAGRGINSCNQQLQKIIDENDLKERVLLLDERNDIPRLTAALDIAVSSSAGTESFSNVLGEAMSCGIPCVVTDIGDSSIIVGDTGRVVPPQDAYSLACAIESLMNEGPEELNRLGKASRDKIINNFSLQTIARQYEKLYSKILS